MSCSTNPELSSGSGVVRPFGPLQSTGWQNIGVALAVAAAAARVVLWVPAEDRNALQQCGGLQIFLLFEVIDWRVREK
jgi:hypothetical protein